MSRYGVLLLLPALLALASAQCDPPEIIAQSCSEDIIVCPDDQPDTAVTYEDCADCKLYWECYNGCANQLECGDGLLYDQLAGCNTAEMVTCGARDCDGEPCNTGPTNAPSDFDCPSDGTFADPDNCIKYIQCSGDVAVEIVCPIADTGEQELWCEECNGGQGYCDYPENVYCGARPICDEFDENCELQPTEAPSQCDAIPCGSGLTYEPLGPCEECYCECSGGNVFDICCPDGLYFNPDLEICDWDYNNPGCD